MLRSVRQLSSGASKIWAKTGQGDNRQLWMPLYVHMGDSAAIARYLWRWLPESTRCYVRNQTGLDACSAECLVTLVAGLHDIGKCTPNFQAKVEERMDYAQRYGYRFAHVPKSFSHAFMGELALKDLLPQRGWTDAAARACASVVGGHHGANPNRADLKTIQQETLLDANAAMGDEVWCDTREELTDWLISHTVDAGTVGDISKCRVPPYAQILLTGIVIMADWIASNTDFFPLVESVDAWQSFEGRAHSAWNELALPNHLDFRCDSASERLFRVRFPNIPPDATMFDVQGKALMAAQDMRSPSLLIIEAPMGCGKTEASLLCAEVLASKFGMGGIGYLLPTMATSNAMFRS